MLRVLQRHSEVLQAEADPSRQAGPFFVDGAARYAD